MPPPPVFPSCGSTPGHSARGLHACRPLHHLRVMGRAILQPSIAPRRRREEVAGRADRQADRLMLLDQLLPAGVPASSRCLGSIPSSVFATPTESGGPSIGALGGMALAMVYRAFSFPALAGKASTSPSARRRWSAGSLSAPTSSPGVFSYLGGEHLIGGLRTRARPQPAGVPG